MDFAGFRKTENRNQDMLGGSSKRVRKESKAKKTIDQYFGIVEPKNKNQGEESQTYNGLEQFENYKKLVKIEEKKGDCNDISRILFKKSLRERFEKVSSLQTVQQLLAVPQYQLLSKVFSLLDIMLKKQSMSFQEIILQFKQDYEIEFKVQLLQKILTIWPQSYCIFWKKQQTLVIGIEENTVNLERRTNKFNSRMLQYIQQYGEHIELHQLPHFSHNQEDFETISKPLPFTYQENILQQIALELQRYFQLRNVSNMYLGNVERYLQKLSLIQNKRSFLQYIDELIQKFPEWIALVSGEQDKIIRVNKSLDIGIMIMENLCLECY